jgi:pyruvate-ferredoxin/flavodoxin oxidoreductase
MTTAMQNQKAAVNSAQWLLYRFNPERTARGENPLQLDSAPPRLKVAEYLNLENRFRMLTKSKPEAARKYFEKAQLDVETRWQLYQHLASRSLGQNGKKSAVTAPAPNVELKPQEQP